MSSSVSMRPDIRDPKVLRRLYHDQGLTIRDILDATGMNSTSHIAALLRKAGIPVRKRGRVPVKPRTGAEPDIRNPDILRSLYIDRQLSTTEIAMLAGLQPGASGRVSCLLREAGIPTRPVGARNRQTAR